MILEHPVIQDVEETTSFVSDKISLVDIIVALYVTFDRSHVHRNRSKYKFYSAAELESTTGYHFRIKIEFDGNWFH